jgi:hypothetical protein
VREVRARVQAAKFGTVGLRHGAGR